ncbi:hypothetical protein [Anabaenopsis elenkinii]|uniref:Uncharacterized protein n=1 Tax=Anabaenopsis elenkinii CCIBt3563 TaxID=2779889 RepID=A0A7S6RCP4_9CYAN|nr:hypothetical protein [Anabaenopsis elenkinii]QOV22519.1 hypothetical protein IM676_17950 [Anabaenopsis elenkinii CCIBt3563]
MQTIPNSVHDHPAKPSTSKSYPTSVPLYVYRQLAHELHITQVKLDALTSQNHQLHQENQLLRQEISKVVQSCLHLQNYVNSSSHGSNSQVTDVTGKLKSPAPKSHPRQHPPVVNHTSHEPEFSAPVETNHQIPETFYLEQQEVNYYSPTEKKVKELSSWWLAMMILLLILTAFGAGYLIMAPLFKPQNP